MNYHYISYHNCVARDLIQEGDVLLFRGSGLISRLIKIASQGPYTHVGLASWVYDSLGNRAYLECVEFREWKGGRAVNLQKQIELHNQKIDVYRASTPFIEPYFKNGIVKQHKIHFSGRTITNCLRKVTGIPYGWRRIWWLGKHHFLGTRLWLPKESHNDILEESVVYPVCSTVVAHCFHSNFTDLTHNRSNLRMEPSDIARSPILNYLFTLEI